MSRILAKRGDDLLRGPQKPDEEEGIVRTRRVVRSMVPHARIVERDQNLGCANSIIAGVTEVCEREVRVIVVEDDLVFSPHALRYFNDALDFYEHEERVMHVAGYMYPVRRAVPEMFLYREVTCWGWATWRRAWRHFEPERVAVADGTSTKLTSTRRGIDEKRSRSRCQCHPCCHRRRR
jgi:hypothetical protein